MPLDTVDQNLLTAARSAADRLAESERQAALSRADYHHAVRRLHLAGAPLRDVAEALGISHQRVQQIVKAGGGTWWSRVWHGRRMRRDIICSYCGRPPGEVAKMIAGPKVYICDRCIDAAEHALRGGKPASAAAAPMARTKRGRCSFCGRRSFSGRTLVGTDEKRVCDACLGLCRQILDDRSASQ
jgi:ClpX C4-type zinc finger protein